MESIETGSISTEYEYDGLGRRMSRVHSSGSGQSVRQYLYDGNLVILEVDGSGDLVTTYTRGLDIAQGLETAGGVGSLLAQVPSVDEEPKYYFYDGEGNVALMLDDAHNEVARYSYDPFGRVLSSSGSFAQANTYQFSTKEYEADWGLNYYLYRYYDAEMGRWLSRDPIGAQGGVNIYVFVGNDPVDNWDLWGMLTVYDKTKTFGSRELPFVWFELTVRLKIDVDLEEGVWCRTIKPDPSTVNFDGFIGEYSSDGYYWSRGIEGYFEALGEGIEARLGFKAGFSTSGSNFWWKALDFSMDNDRYGFINIFGQRFINNSETGGACGCLKTSSETSISLKAGVKPTQITGSAAIAAGLSFLPVKILITGGLLAAEQALVSN